MQSFAKGGRALPHSDFLTAFRAGLQDGTLPPGLTAIDPAETGQRFAVYRNNVAVGLSEALAARFPVIRRLVGEEFFAALARGFIRDDRPASPVIAEWGEGFADFLRGFAPLVAHPYMADVARLEHARGRAFHAADAMPVAPGDLAACAPDRLILGLHPSVQVLRFGHAAISVWLANQPDGPPVRDHARAETALILRDPAFQVHVVGIAEADAALIEALQQGRPLADAARCALRIDPDHSAQHILVRLMSGGAITSAQEEAP